MAKSLSLLRYPGGKSKSMKRLKPLLKIICWVNELMWSPSQVDLV